MQPLRFLALLLVSARILSAHECWLQPSRFEAAPGEPLTLQLRVGMEFQGEARPFNAQRASRLTHLSARGTADWSNRATGQTDLGFTLPQAGTHVLALDSGASYITLEADKFNAYLKEEGLNEVLAQREQAGESRSPGRERYLRCIKTVIQAGGRPDAAWQTRTGQRLELVPLDDPASVRPGGSLRVQLYCDGQPLAGSLVRAWHRDGGKLTVLDARTSADGAAAFTLTGAGAWMVSTVRMARVPGDAQADWESLWGNLTFSVAAETPDSHPLRGEILGISTEKTALLVKHETVPGVMRAMTMLFKVEPSVLTRVQRHDTIQAQLQHRDDGWWLVDVTVVTPAAK